MLKAKNVLSALCFVVAMTMATSTFAQGTFTVSSTPTSRARSTGHTEITGNITLALTGPIGATPAAGGTVTIALNVPITNDEIAAAGSAIEVVGSGCFGGGTVAAGDDFPTGADALADADVSVNNLGGTVVLTLAGKAAAACAAGDSIIVSNVHASVTGLAVNSQLKANISAAPGSGFQIVAGQDNPTIISSILAPLVSGSLTRTGAAGTVLANGLVVGGGAFTIVVTENFFDALQSAPQLGGGALNDVQIGLTFAGVPAGMTINLTGATINVPTGGNGIGGAAVLSGTTITSTVLTRTISAPVIAAPGPYAYSSNAVNTVTITGVISGVTTGLPLTAGNITVTADIVPTGTSTLITEAAGSFPRFQSSPTAAVTVGTIVPAQTNLLLPFVAVTGNYDTAVSIANTTADPFTGTNASFAQNGAITFDFYPQTGTTFTYTTSATSPGLGLTSGVLNSGGSYTVLVSQLLGAITGAPTSFSGYVIATANFTNGHGGAYVTDFSGFTASTEVLVIPPPNAGNARVVAGGEVLGN
jgi:hypothetical protein